MNDVDEYLIATSLQLDNINLLTTKVTLLNDSRQCMVNKVLHKLKATSTIQVLYVDATYQTV